MLFPAWRGRAPPLDHDVAEAGFEEPLTLAVLDVGERICPPPEARGGSMLGATLFILVILGAGWGLLQTQADWLELLGAKVSAIAALMRDGQTADAQSETSSIAVQVATIDEPPAEVRSIESAPSPPSSESVADPPADASIETGIETGAISPAPPAAALEPLPPPRADPADPYQKRALAVGLHPELSRALLSRLSATDYRNARYAIDTAIAKTSGDSEFVWPRQRTPVEALFRVQFVAGAAPHCRRYVVTVTKDRWSTTAPAMERCAAGIAAR